MTERLRFLLTLVVLAVAGFAGMTALRSRGGDESGGGSDTAKRIFSTDVPLESGKFRFEVKARVNGLPQLAAPVVVAGSGAFQTHGKGKQLDFDFKAGVNAPGFDEEVGARMAKGALYLMQDGRFFTVADAGRVRAFMQPEKGKEVDDTKLLAELKHEGSETLDGVETDHVSAQLDVAALMAEIERQSESGGQIPDEVGTFMDEAIRDSKLEVWAGKDDQRIRKVAFHLGFQTPDRLEQQAQGLSGGDLDVEVSFTDVGKPQRIGVPRDPGSLQELGSQFGRIFGAGMLGGVTNGGAGEAEERKPAQPAEKADPSDYDSETREYLACVAKAAKPVALQKCIADLP